MQAPSLSTILLLSACTEPPVVAEQAVSVGTIETRTLSKDDFRSIDIRPTLPPGYEAVAVSHDPKRLCSSLAVVPALGAEPILLTLDIRTGDLRRVSDGSNALVAGCSDERQGLLFEGYVVGDTDGDGADECLIARGGLEHTARYTMDLTSVRTSSVLATAARGTQGTGLVRSCSTLARSGRTTEFAFTTTPWTDLEEQEALGRLEVLRMPSLESKFVVTAPKPRIWWGWAVTWVEDFDGDGASDLLVSAPQFRNRSGSVGRLDLLSGRDGHALATFAPEDFGIRLSARLDFGWSLTALHDFDGDGVREIVIVANGGTRSSSDGQDVPRIMLVNLRARSLIRDLEFAVGDFPSVCSPELFTIDDCDGDKIPDLCVVCPQYVESSRDRLSMCGSCSFTSSGTGTMLAAFLGKSDRDDGEGVNGAYDARTRMGRSGVVVSLGSNDVWIRPAPR